MSSREAADLLRTMLPFAKAIVDLGGHADMLEGLDSAIEAKQRGLVQARSDHAALKSASTTLEQTAQAQRDDLQRQLAESRKAHDSDLNAERAAFAADKQKQLAALDELKAQHQSQVQVALDEAQKKAAAIVDEAHETAAAVKAEYADLEDKLPALRTAHASASALLDDINARIDSHRAR